MIRIFGWSTRGMVMWGLFLMALGTMILLANYGVMGFPFVFSRDWPMILIAWGMLKIADALTQKAFDKGFSFWKKRADKRAYQDIINDLMQGRITQEEAKRQIDELNLM